MNSHPQHAAGTGSLTREHWDVPIRVRLVPYVEFSRWLDAELKRLVWQWSDKAAPSASGRSSGRAGKSRSGCA
jgi:hypothetical protein